MKATIEIPDDLYRLVKAKSGLEGRAIREVTEDLFRRWVAEAPVPAGASTEAAGAWLANWIALADDVMRKAPAGPTARDHLVEDRKRLERR
ncbi:MAG TPA: hypothetical protein VFY93_06395 [Planctomycetota bacterium]|nr:hypothetical protein [Planctomycetota bacterium]